MANFAVIENNKIINLILADNLETAESITGKTCIVYSQEEILPIVGWDCIDGVIIKPTPQD
jgi:hypothetical protein